MFTNAITVLEGVEWSMLVVALLVLAAIAGRSTRMTGITHRPYHRRYSDAPGAAHPTERS